MLERECAASNKAQMASVLCTGWDKSLLDTRTMILQSAGHDVRQARTQNEVVSACQQHRFDVVVIGQTVSARMKRLIVSLVKEHCTDAKILELYQPHLGKAVEDADSWLEVPAEIPSDLAERVGELAQDAESNRGRAAKSISETKL
jgi:DNA-binding NtrC family response regulator